MTWVLRIITSNTYNNKILLLCMSSCMLRTTMWRDDLRRTQWHSSVLRWVMLRERSMFDATRLTAALLTGSATRRGRHLLAATSCSSSRCVACHLCDEGCPVLAITVSPVQRSSMHPRSSSAWVLDVLRCVVCGLCQDYCPVAAVSEKLAHLCSWAGSRRQVVG